MRQQGLQMSPDAWRAYLAALPEIDPPPALRARVLAALGAPARRHDRRAGRGWAAAACLALAAAGVSWWMAPGKISRDLTTATRGGISESESAVRRIDDALAEAYARQAAEAEIATLWNARERVLMVANEQVVPIPVRL